jgi:hypothetical protein
MGDRHVTQQSILALLGKLDDPDADLRYMSLNDLFNILSNPNSSFLTSDERSASRLADGLLKALDDQHGDVQNQALKWCVTAFFNLDLRLMQPTVSAPWLFAYHSMRLCPCSKN